MDLISTLLSVALFYTFVPGVVFTYPRRSSPATVLVVHALLFALTLMVVMRFYWKVLREQFGNYGPTCPNGYVVGQNQGNEPDCVPVGHPTYSPGSAPSTKLVSQ